MRTNNRKPITTEGLIDKGYKPVFYNTNSGVVMSCNIQWTSEDWEILGKVADDWNAGKPMDCHAMAGMRIITSPSIKDPARKPNDRPGWTVAILKHL